MKAFHIFIILIFLFFSVPSVSANPNLSDAFSANDDSPLQQIAQGAGYNRTATGNFDSILANVIQIILSLLGVFFMVLMIYGGFLWMNDRGNSDYVDKAKKLITAAFIGMIIVLLSYAISVYVFEQLSRQTLGESTPEINYGGR